MWTSSSLLALDPLKLGFKHQTRGGDWTLGRHPGVSATARKQTEGHKAEETGGAGLGRTTPGGRGKDGRAATQGKEVAPQGHQVAEAGKTWRCFQSREKARGRPRGRRLRGRFDQFLSLSRGDQSF